MRILALNPPNRFSKNVARDLLWGCWCKGKRIAGVQFPPLPLLYVGTVLKEDGNQVDLLDSQGERVSLNEVKKRILNYDVVFLISATMSFQEDTFVLQQLKEANPKLTTICFGAHATFKPENALDHQGVDIIVQKEAEWVVRDVVRELKKGGDSWKKVKGIGYRENGKKIINELYPFITNLDDLPIPDRSMLPKDLEYYNPIVKRIPATTALSSRGCPSQCTYCTAPAFYGPVYRARSAGNVVKELEYLVGLGYKEIFFRDELFTVIPQRVTDICEGILEKKLDVSWICSVKINTVNEKMIRIMKQAGCHMIRIGVETGNQEILNNVKKGVKIENVIKTFDDCNAVGLDTHAHMMLGMPGETKETVYKTFDFIERIKPTTITYGVTTPYPGTPLYDQIYNDHPEIGDGSQIDASKIHTTAEWNKYYTSLTNEELSGFVREGYRRFYIRPSYIYKWMRKINNLAELRRVTMAGTQVFDFALRGEGG